MDLVGGLGIVTGGLGGIGFTITNTLAEAGVTAYAVSRTGQPKDAEKDHEGVIHVAADVGNYSEMENLVKEVREDKGINSLINNAGITVKCRTKNLDDSDFGHIMKVNISSISKLSCLCYPYLKKSTGRGRIVNIISMAACLRFSEVVLYCASKGVALSMIRGLAVEWSGNSINVNSIIPSWFPSKMGQQVIDAEHKAKIPSRIPIYKFGDTRDIAEMTRCLASDSAGYITGQGFAVDSGALAFGF